MTQLPPWLLALAAAVPVLAALGVWWSRRVPPEGPQLPREWALASRPVFNVHERRVLRQMREAFPEHVILAKLPLVRLCQPLDPSQVQYWFGLLASIHVGFLVCSVNGRVLAAIDLDEGTVLTARSQHIKQSVLGACGIRYVRYPSGHLPTVAELQMLVPPGAGLPGTLPVGTAPDLVGTPPARGETSPASSTHWPYSDFMADSLFNVSARDDFRPTVNEVRQRRVGADSRNPGSRSSMLGQMDELVRRRQQQEPRDAPPPPGGGPRDTPPSPSRSSRH